MTKISASADVSNVEMGDLSRFVTQFQNNVLDVVNGNLTFGENIKSQLAPVSFGAANTEVQIGHTLKKVPSGYIVAAASVAMQVFNGTSANTSEFLYIQSTAAGSAQILIF
jgi:hypothetical protein